MEVALVVISPLVGFLGVLVGQVFVRSRELRDMRREAYMAWMRAARGLSMWVGEIPSGGAITFPHLERLHELNLRTTDLGIVASRRVLQAADTFMDVWTSEDFGQEMAAVKGYRAILGKADELTLYVRRKVQKEMRRDLFPWWKPGEWDTSPREES